MKKITELEKGLESTNLLYHESVTEKAVIRIQNQVNIFNIIM